jgi:hypothetical protein
MSRKTSTAALDSFRRKLPRTPCRFPRHPAGARKTDSPRSNVVAEERPGRRIRHSERVHVSGRTLQGKPSLFIEQAQLSIHEENTMNPLHRNSVTSIRTIVPVVLRIAFSLILWTLGAASMNLAAAEPKEHRAVYNFSVERAKIEDLQRWVNAGHDSWCRDPQLVAATSLRRVVPDSEDFDLASLPLEVERSQKTSAVYVFHSLDGNTTYRVTVRRYRWLLPVAGNLHKTIWVPEHAEILTRDSQTVARDSAHSDAA